GGFCWGVERAIEIADEVANTAANRAKGTVRTFGPLVHNHEALQGIEHKGVFSDMDVDTMGPDDFVVLRAHGIAPDVKKRIKESGARVYDGTCPDVGHIHATVRREMILGKANVVVVGDAGHAEVDGILGVAGEKGIAVGSPAECDKVAFPTDEPLCVVSQSTQEFENYEAIVNKLKERYPQVQGFNTICEATTSRQADLKKLIAECDAIVVIGARHSANTCRLAQIAEEAGKDTYLIENEGELDLEKMRKYHKVGITAGASTPPAAMHRAAEILRPLQPAA
ncbi:MAG: 4-hydroxy-3-methylbut-2-enyl diphosphate reductase, partial [Chrysiogenetes bacterium]|nr:4-hydroxy-3-methylbut-2-enyl diphosphate reductase [Chrysiogenetes bacterium]